MRTRSRTDPAIGVVGAYQREWDVGGGWIPDGSAHQAGGTQLLASEYSETITDDPTPGSSMKPVMHSKRTYEAVNQDVCIFKVDGIPRRVQTSFAVRESWGAGSLVQFEPTAFTVTWAKTDQMLLNDAIDAFLNLNEVDTLLNIIEAPGLPSALNKMSQTIASSRVDRALRLINQGFLTWSFGLGPLLSDMIKVTRELNQMDKKLKLALKRRGKPVSVHKSCKGYVTSPTTVVGGYFEDRHILTIGSPKKVCTVVGVNTHNYNSGAFNAFDHIVSTLGVTGPASFVWERIPFSFVVDWFIDLRSTLGYLDNILTGNTKRIKSACISTKWGGSRGRYIIDSTSIQPDAYTPVCATSVESYQRYLVEPAFKPIFRERFGKKQLALTGALLYELIVAKRIR